MTPLVNPAISGEVYSLVPSTREGVELLIDEAIPRAILPGSETKPPIAQPRVSTRVRLT